MKKTFIIFIISILLTSCFWWEEEKLDLPESPLMQQEINQEIIRKENKIKKESLEKDLSETIDNFLEDK